MTTALAKQNERNTLEEILKRPAYSERFKQVLGDKASQFCSSLVSIGKSMPEVEPKSIIGSAMVAACLDLPIEKNLGFAWIVPYKSGGQKFAQFQMGYKGFIQLALRTGYYAGMNACAINKEAYGGKDAIGEPIIDWEKVDESKPAIGYVFAFRMVNGFSKICYWSKEKVLAHAKQYSQSYRSGNDTPWKTHFDRMAIKTVIANELSDWGILSVQFQLARKSDQGVLRDVDAEVEYLDNDKEQLEDKKPEPTGHQLATGATQTGTQNAPVAQTPPKEGEKTPQDKPGEQTPAETPGTPAATPEPTKEAESTPNPKESEPPEEPDQAFAAKAGDTDALASVKLLASKAGLSYNQLKTYLVKKKLQREEQALGDLAEAKLLNIATHIGKWLPDIKALPR